MAEVIVISDESASDINSDANDTNNDASFSDSTDDIFAVVKKNSTESYENSIVKKEPGEDSDEKEQCTEDSVLDKHLMEIDYYQGNLNLPIYERGRREYTVSDLVSILLGNVDQENICKEQPLCVEHSCSFVVDLECVPDPNDLRADDNGVWKHSGVRKNYIIVNGTKKILYQSRERFPKLCKSGSRYVLVRVYHALQASTDFRRMIATLEDTKMQKLQYALVQYRFQRKEHSINKPPHRNSKGSTPYKRTNPSTIKRMKEVAKGCKPSAAFELIDVEMGGLGASSSTGKLPRSKAQLSDVRKRLFESQHTDELAMMMEKCKCLSKGDVPFVRSVQAAPQPLCVLATDTQLKQLQLCCTDPNNFSVLCIDPTFNLGTFFVTPMVFLHKVVLAKRTKKHPLFLGPMLIHQRMNTDAYSYFAYQVQILLPGLRHIQATGTDGEVALTTAFENAFPDAIHLRCFKHFRENCETKLRDLNFSSSALQEILADIFGLDDSEQRQLGLVDASDASDFTAKLDVLEKRWNKLEKENRKALPGEIIVPQFYSWFVKEKSNVVKNNMIKSVRISAQLGDPPIKFYTNASESANNILKIKTERKPQSLTAFVEHVQDLVQTYEKNLERAFHRRGDWRVATLLPDFEDQMSQNKIQIVIKTVTEASCRLSLLLDKEIDVRSVASGSEEYDIVTEDPELPCSSKDKELSVSYHPLIKNIYEDTLRGIWKKAKMLVNDASLIVPVPGSSTTSSSSTVYHRMVASSTGESPHFVTTPVKFTGQFKCDTKCPMYATYKLCSHTIAVAETNGKLAEFINWIIKQKCTANLTNLSMIGMPKGAGQKGGVPKYTRKRKKNDSAQSKKVIDRLSDHSSVTDNESMPKAPRNIAYTATVHGQQINVQGQGMSTWSIDCPQSGTVSVNNPFAFHYDTAHLYYPTPGHLMPSSMPTHLNVLPYSMSTTSSNCVVSPYPFTLKILTPRIQICQGCRIPFHSDNDQPPYDLIVCRKECRPYKAHNGEMKTPSTPNNSHYHINLNCIRAAAPSFLPSELVVPDDVLAYLTDVHKGFIFGMLGIRIP